MRISCIKEHQHFLLFKKIYIFTITVTVYKVGTDKHFYQYISDRRV